MNDAAYVKRFACTALGKISPLKDICAIRTAMSVMRLAAVLLSLHRRQCSHVYGNH